MTVVVPHVTVAAETLTYLGLDPRKPETRALVLLCERYGLDPLLGHVTIVQTKAGFRPYITRDGMLEIAHRSGQLDGIVVDEQRRNTTGDGWTAYVSVYRKDCAHPFRYGAQCKDGEIQAKTGNGPEMALARAERRALIRAFAIPASEEPAERSQQIAVPAVAPDLRALEEAGRQAADDEARARGWLPGVDADTGEVYDDIAPEDF